MRIIQTDKPLRKRDEHDFYPTPCAYAESGMRLLPFEFNPAVILDPGAGTGVWGQAARRDYPYASIVGVELRDVPKPSGYNYWFNGDFRTFGAGQANTVDLIIGNPPYKYTEQFLKVCFELLNEEGWIVFLLPLQFLAGQARSRGLHRKHPPKQVAVCSSRPSFTGDGKTDASEYAYFVWNKGYQGDPRVSWINVKA